MFNVLQPEGWAPAKGYANGIEARGRMVFVAGMIGWNGQAQFETDDFVAIASEFRSLAHLPGIAHATVFEPAPEEMYVWKI